MKTYYLDIEKKTCDYLQRLEFEIRTSTNVITKLITQAKDDSDASVLDGIPFKTYHKNLEKSEYEYQLAKDELTDYLRPIVQEKEGDENVSFNWNLEDFRVPRVKIIVLDNTHNCSCESGSCNR